MPFIERSKQSLTRSCNEINLPLRARYSGNTPQMPIQGEALALVPPAMWQLVQARPFPTLFGKRCEVSLTNSLPSRIATPLGPAGTLESGGAAKAGAWAKAGLAMNTAKMAAAAWKFNFICIS